MHRKYFSFLSLLALCALSGPVLGATAEKAKDERVVKDGMMVSLDYTLKSPDGKLIETSKGREPLKYIHGQKMMIPGLEKELTAAKLDKAKRTAFYAVGAAEGLVLDRAKPAWRKQYFEEKFSLDKHFPSEK